MKRKWLSVGLAAAMAWFCAAPAAAQNPIVVLSIKQLDELFQDASHCVKLAAPDAKKDAALASLKLADPYLEGVDRTRPAGGAVFLTDDGSFGAVGFIPITSKDAFFGVLTKNNLPLEDAEGGLKKIGAVHFKAEKNYVYIAGAADQLATLPDPVKTLGVLPETYDVGVSLTLKNIPGFFRQLIVSQMQGQLERGIDNDDEEAAEMQKALLKQQIKAINKLMEEIERIDFGLSVERSAGKIFTEVVVQAKNGTGMAKQLAAVKDFKTFFPALRDASAPISIGMTSINDDEDQKKQQLVQIDQFEKMLEKQIEDSDEIPDDEGRELAEDAAEVLVEVLRDLVEDGRVDGAFLVDQTEGKQVRVLAAAYIPDAKRLEEVAIEGFKYLSKKDEKKKVDLKQNAAKHGGVAFHQIVPVEPAPEEVKQILGADPSVFFGFGEDVVWFGLGTDVLKQLKESVDGSGEDNAKLGGTDVNVSVSALMKLASLGEKDAEKSKKLSLAAAAAGPGQDRVHMFVETNDKNQGVFRLEIADGILKIIKAATESDE